MLIRDDDNGSSAGAAYIFIRDNNRWVEQAKLLPQDGASGDQFGYSLALAGDTAIVGAFLDDNERGTNAGSAYIFVREGNEWIEQAKLMAR